MNDDVRQRATDEVRQSSGFQRNRPFSQYDNYTTSLKMTTQLLDPKEIESIQDGFESIIRSLSDLLKTSNLTTAEYTKIDALIQNMNKNMEVYGKDSNKAVDNAKALNAIMKDLNKNSDLLNKNTAGAVQEFINLHNESIGAANDLTKQLSKDSKTFLENLGSNVSKLKSEVIQLANAFNLQKLVAGGTSLESLRNSVSNFRINMNIDKQSFMGVQSSLSDMNSAYGFLREDMQQFMADIKQYSFRNSSQATALYKQVVMGTKYLGMSNQSMSSLVQSTKQLASDNYMDKQMSILASLNSDSKVAEDLDSLATFMSNNSSGARARYGNYEQLLGESVGVLSAVEGQMGSKYRQMLEGVYNDVIQHSDFSGLSQENQQLLTYAGMTSDVWAQMRAGNFSPEEFAISLLSGLNNRVNSKNGSMVLENFINGSGSDWVNLASAYGLNESQINSTIRSQVKTATSGKSTDELLKELNKDNVRERTTPEYFYDKFIKSFGLETQDWTKLLGITQVFSAVTGGIIAISQLGSVISKLGGGKAAEAVGKHVAGSSSGGFFSGLGAKFGATKLGSWLGSTAYTGAGGAAVSNAALLGGAGLIAGGTIAGISDAIKMQGSTGNGWLADSARGLFLGTGASNHTKGENTGSTLGNTAKWAAIGAGIGTFIAPGVGTAIGGLAGGVAGLVGGLIGNTIEDNTRAVEENTAETYKVTNDPVLKSAINKMFINNKANDEGAIGGSITYGVGAGGTSNNGGYPWKVTSPYGPRWGGFHNGMDFGIPIGTPIGAPVGGKITWTQNDPRNTWKTKDASAGTGVYMLGDDGIKYIFWHMSKLGVKAGQRVSTGQTLGLSGNTGYSSGPHLHFGTKKGSYMNPAPYATNGLFAADGKMLVNDEEASYVPSNVDANPGTNVSSSVKQYLSRESVFSTTASKGAAPDEPVTSTPNYATSADIDRLIKAMGEMNAAQQDQRDFLRALAGTNTFVYGRE